MQFFKKKVIVLLLILSIAFFVPVQTARADAVVDFVSGAATALINAVVDTLSFAISVAVPVLAVSGGVFIAGLTGGLAGGGTYLILCELGMFGCGDDSSGVALVSVSSTGVEGACNFQIPMTFYNPRMNISYKEVPTTYEEGCDNDDCKTTAGVVYVEDPNFNETDRQVAIYRFVLPADSTQLELNDWFVNQIKQKGGVGDGWTNSPTYYCGEYNQEVANQECLEPLMNGYMEASDTEPLVTVKYSDLCSNSNVCNRFTDKTVPKESYVAYVAKILGDYTYVYYLYGQGPYYPSDTFNPYQRSALLPNKFFNNDNASSVRFPEGDLGNAIVGPFKTGTPVCTSTLTITKAGTGSGTVTSSSVIPESSSGVLPDVLSWTSNIGTATYTDSNYVTLTAVADPGSIFSGWSGEGCSGNLYPCGVSMNADRSVTATFVPKTFNLSCNATPLKWEQYYSSSFWSRGWKTRFRSTLTASVTGTATGPVVYTFDCSNGVKQSLTDIPTYDCLYPNAGNPATIKIDATRDGLTAPTCAFSLSNKLGVSFSASPNPVETSKPTTITAIVSGTATGDITYNFNCAETPYYNQSTHSPITTSNSQASRICTYYSPGVVYPSVTVTRSGTTVSTNTSVNVTASVMSGTLTPSSSTCSITTGNTCTKTLTWSITNPKAIPTAITASEITNILPALNQSVTNSLITPQSGTQSVTVPYSGARTFYLYNNAVPLATATVTPVINCALGYYWDNGSDACVLSPISVSLSANPSPVTLPANSTNFTWTTTGSPTSCTASNSVNSLFWSGSKPAGGGGPYSVTLPSSAGSYTYTITCSKSGVANASWSIPVTVNPAVVNGACSSPAKHYTCASGSTYAGDGTSSPSKWTWTCTGSGGGASISCAEKKSPGFKED